MIEVPVLIVGGGPVGLASALMLSRFEIPSMVVEKDATTALQPKARALQTRSVELFREWGLLEAIDRWAQPLESWRLIFCESLSGQEYARIEDPVDIDSVLSPTYRRVVMQSHVEAELAAALKSRTDVDLRFNTEFVSLEQDKSGVTATLRDLETRAEEAVRCEFLIGADGTRSTVQRAIGTRLKGDRGLVHMLSIYHRANLEPYVKDRPSAIFLTLGAGANILVVNGKDEWVAMKRYDPNRGETLEDFTPERCVEIVRRAAGIKDLEVEIITVDSFVMNAQIADAFRNRRVFLAGDAAHRMPTYGGFGMNTGLQDAHNLMWKLTAVLQGKASDALLDTYDEERRPVVEANTRWANDNGTRTQEMLAAIRSGDARRIRSAAVEVNKRIVNQGMDLGFAYASGALVSDGISHPPQEPSIYVPSSRPGVRAPHVWLEHKGKRISTLDLYGKEFVVLAGKEGRAWCEAASTVAQKNGIQITAYSIGDGADFRDPKGDWGQVYEVGDQGAVLIRPDGHVAWRSMTAGQDCEETLKTALSHILRTDLK